MRQIANHEQSYACNAAPGDRTRVRYKRRTYVDGTPLKADPDTIELRLLRGAEVTIPAAWVEAVYRMERP